MTERYCIAKDYKRANGSQSWGVYDNVTKKIVEGGFFSKAAARNAANALNNTCGQAVGGQEDVRCTLQTGHSGMHAKAVRP